jgi:SAM-dependent methyltransferase
MVNLINPFTGKPANFVADGIVDEQGTSFPYRNGAYRIVSDDNYSENFGFQWNKFAKTQIDNSENEISKIRFFAETSWDKEDLADKNVLEVGSGAGRFSEVILQNTKANLFSIDYSNAVEANFKNNGHHGARFKIFQASIYEMPFAPQQFDKVVCVGVLQHTPDFKKSVKSLIDQVKPGGELVVDFYPINGWWTKVNAKYMFRPFTKNMNHERLLKLIEKNAGWLMKLYFFFNKIGIGRFVNRFLPLCDIKGTLPANLSKKELKEWVILDTFDMFSPAHDHPQKISTVKNWFKEFGMQESFSGYIKYGTNFKAAVVKGIKPGR